MLFCSDPDNRPDVQRCSQAKYEAREQDCRGCPLKLAMLAIIEVRERELGKEEHGQNQVYCRKYHIVDHCLDLLRGRIPGAFHSASHVAGTGGQCGGAEHTGQNQRENNAADEFFVELHFYTSFI